MNLLLDSHALLWWLDDNPRLGPAARAAIGSAASVAVSLASIWEIAIKVSLGKLSVDLEELLANVRRDGFDLLPITAADCLAVARLPHHHGAPFDRMLIAQACERGLTLVSDDRNVAAYGITALGCG
jgi:PIN domain nuclease of toxin-antitoxin system